MIILTLTDYLTLYPKEPLTMMYTPYIQTYNDGHLNIYCNTAVKDQLTIVVTVSIPLLVNVAIQFSEHDSFLE
jgi:hypothetical protein